MIISNYSINFDNNSLHIQCNSKVALYKIIHCINDIVDDYSYDYDPDHTFSESKPVEKYESLKDLLQAKLEKEED